MICGWYQRVLLWDTVIDDWRSVYGWSSVDNVFDSYLCEVSDEQASLECGRRK